MKLDRNVLHAGNTISHASHNRWGQPRGYGIVVDKSTYQMLPDNHPLTIAMGWSKHNLAITKRKDSEPKSCTGLYDMNIPQEPYTSFNDIMNGKPAIFDRFLSQ